MNPHSFALALLVAAALPLGAAADAVLNLEPAVDLVLRAGPHEVNVVERARYFRTFHLPGMFSDARNAELQSLAVSPARGTGPYFSDSGGDTQRVGWHPDIDTQIQNYVTLYRRAAALYPGQPHAIGGGSYPNFAAPRPAVGGDAAVEATMQVAHVRSIPSAHHDTASALIERWLGGIQAGGGAKPRFFSPLNEPDTSWRDTPKPAQDHADFARNLATRLASSHPDVRVSGPCTAWPYPGPEWKRWLPGGWERAFIDTAGDKVGAYDLHLYSKELWAYGPETPGYQAARLQPTPNLYASLLNGHNHVWDFGKVDGLLDLIYAYHQQRWQRPGLPMIITEFGRQGITPQKGPWPNDYLYYLYGTTTTRLWMRFMDRPEVALTVPFILPESDAGYAPERGQALYNRPDGKTLQPTPLVGFYRFFQSFAGTRIPAAWSGVEALRAAGLSVIAVRQADAILVLIHNAPPTPLTFRLGNAVSGPVRIARLRWEAPLPADFRAPFTGGWRQDAAPGEIIDPARITLAGEETAILRLPLEKPVAPTRRVIERFYARETLQPLQAGKSIAFTLTLPATGPAVLMPTIALPAGSATPGELAVTINGHRLPSPLRLDLFRGWREIVHPLPLPVPAGLLRAGENRIEFTPLGSGWAAHSYVPVLRIDLRREP